MGNVIEGLADHVTEKITEQGSAQNGTLQYAASGMKGWRNTMEDCHTLCTSIPVEGKNESLEDHSLFAVYDGHGGSLSSAFAGREFVRLFARRPEWKKYADLPKEGSKSRADVTGVDLLRSALTQTFLDLDQELRNLQMEHNEAVIQNSSSRDQQERRPSEGGPTRLERSGCTCIVALISRTHIICANAGDSRAILRRRERVLPLSFDHKPSNVPEQERIVSCGGFVKAKRVDGDLAVSRGLGDFVFKSQADRSTHRQKVIAEPDVIVYPRDQDNDEWLVLACDGIWDVASNEQCATMVQEVLDEGETNLGLVCEEMLDICLERNSRDNMTLIIVGFPGMKITKGNLAARNAVWARRASRRARLLEAQAKAVARRAASGVGIDIGIGSDMEMTKKKLTARSSRRKRVRVPSSDKVFVQRE